MRSLTNADSVLYRLRELQEQLSSPKSTRPLGHGDAPIGRCSGPKCKSSSWTWASDGRRRCSRCTRPWQTELAQVLSSDVQTSLRPNAYHVGLYEMRILEALAMRPQLWERRVWILYVLGQVDGYPGAALTAAEMWPQKHGQVTFGFFTPRHARTLVAGARERVERSLAWHHMLA